MTSAEFLELVKATNQKMEHILAAKNADYTAGSEAFANFESAKEWGLEPLIGLMLRMDDKRQRVKSYIVNRELQVQNESLEDAFLDIMGYCHLALGMIRSKDGRE